MKLFAFLLLFVGASAHAQQQDQRATISFGPQGALNSNSSRFGTASGGINSSFKYVDGDYETITADLSLMKNSGSSFYTTKLNLVDEFEFGSKRRNKRLGKTGLNARMLFLFDSSPLLVKGSIGYGVGYLSGRLHLTGDFTFGMMSNRYSSPVVSPDQKHALSTQRTGGGLQLQGEAKYKLGQKTEAFAGFVATTSDASATTVVDLNDKSSLGWEGSTQSLQLNGGVNVKVGEKLHVKAYAVFDGTQTKGVGKYKPDHDADETIKWKKKDVQKNLSTGVSVVYVF